MTTKKRAEAVIIVLVLGCIFVSSVGAQRPELQQKLSKEFSIAFKDVTISEALCKIAKETGQIICIDGGLRHM